MLDLAIVLIFIVVTIGAGFRARRKASESLEEYFLAGRTVSGWRAGLSMAATQFAADTPLVVMGLIALGGIYLFWQFWVYGIAFLMMGFLFGASWRRAGVLTDAELAETRYSGSGKLLLRVLKALYYGTVINCIVMAFVLAATVQIAEVFLLWHLWLPSWIYDPLQGVVTALDLSLTRPASRLEPAVATTNNILSIILLLSFITLYSTTGGLRSVLFTDMVQLGIALLGTLLYAIIVVYEAGGLDGMLTRLVEIYGREKAEQTLSFAPQSLELLAPFLVLMGLQWFYQVNSDGTGYLAQRTMACRTDRDARIAAVVFTWTQVFLRSLIWMVIGVALLVLYPITAEMAAQGDLKAAREATFVNGINDFLPPGISGLMLTGMLAALASTIDTHLNLGASYWSNDIYKRLVNEVWLDRSPQQRELVWVARLSNIFILALALLIMSQLGSIQQGWKISLLFGAGVGPVLVLRWVWERVNVYAELYAIAASLVGGVVLLALFPYDHQEWLRLALMALISTSAVVSAALSGPQTDPKTLQAFYAKARPIGFWGDTARALGEDPAKGPAALWRAILLVAACALSLFFILFGLGRLILHLPGASLTFAWVALVAGVVLIPVWWRGVLASEPADERA